MPEPFLELPAGSIERQKAVGLWYEDDTLRVRGHLRDRYTEPDGRTGICSGWRDGSQLATWMADGRGIAPSHIYPVDMVDRPFTDA